MTSAATDAVSSKTGQRLPALRQELRLVGQTSDLEGDRQWMIYDPVQHRFIGVDHKSFAIIEAWPSAKSPADLIAAAWERRAEIVTLDDIAALSQVLLQSGLAVPADHDANLQALQASASRKRGVGSALLHNYLFFRVPIFNPEPILRPLLPWVRPLGTRRAAWVIGAIGAIGLGAVSREWDEFASAVSNLATLQGALWLVLALLVAKVLHEFSHAFVAIHYGCRVPTLGVAFILGAPLLYVDVSDAWKLASVRARTAINAAGVLVGLSVAAIALTVWVLLPMGTAKDVALAFATTGWLLSLAINLNPFMKFDGYHIVADLVGAANLQSRALAMSQWYLRETLFAPGFEPPETCTLKTRRYLAAFGAATWIYRILLFTAIAVAVYHYFFKLLGLVLFAVEILYFIALPIARELRTWISARKSFSRSTRWRTSAATAAGLFCIVLVPWSSAVYVPAVLGPASLARIHVPRPARLLEVSVVSGDAAIVGKPTAGLASPDLQHERDIVRLKTAIVELRLARVAGDAADRESLSVLRREWESLREQSLGLSKHADALQISAPAAGRLASIAEYLKPGRWIAPDEALAVIHANEAWEMRGLVNGENLARVRMGQRAKFVPDDLGSASIDAYVVAVSAANAPVVEQIELAQTYGGRVPTRPGNRNQLLPVEPQYAVRAVPRDSVAAMERQSLAPRVGMLVISGDARSFASRFWKRIAQVLVRESGF